MFKVELMATQTSPQEGSSLTPLFISEISAKFNQIMKKDVVLSRSVIDTKESDGIADPMEKIAIKPHSDHSDSGIGKMVILIDSYFVIILQCNKITK